MEGRGGGVSKVGPCRRHKLAHDRGGCYVPCETQVWFRCCSVGTDTPSRLKKAGWCVPGPPAGASSQRAAPVPCVRNG